MKTGQASVCLNGSSAKRKMHSRMSFSPKEKSRGHDPRLRFYSRPASRNGSPGVCRTSRTDVPCRFSEDGAPLFGTPPPDIILPEYSEYVNTFTEYYFYVFPPRCFFLSATFSRPLFPAPHLSFFFFRMMFLSYARSENSMFLSRNNIDIRSFYR